MRQFKMRCLYVKRMLAFFGTALLLFFSTSLKAQIENVIVETYYISDSADATDTSAGRMLAKGSITYRVFVDLAPGVKIKKIYGDANHALRFASDSVFFKNINASSSVYFGYQMNKAWFPDNPTLALDTWLTIGLATKTNTGILKKEDPDPTSIIGGSNNLGGSAAIPEGILVNNDTAAGIPLVIADGLVTKSADPLIWKNFAITDSSIFGTIKPDSVFNSYEAYLEQSNGTKGPTPDNKVLVAQLTTKGKLSFELNLEIIDSTGSIKKYVARNGPDSLTSTATLSPKLKYPAECGCKDPQYIEYKSSYSCELQGACKTPAVLGCMDKLACNYDPFVNFNVQSLCCYPGQCNDRDMSVVCPGINNALGFTLYPNPAQAKLVLEISNPDPGDKKEITYEIHNSFGIVLLGKKLGALSDTHQEQVDISGLHAGLYLVRVSNGNATESKLFMKN